MSTISARAAVDPILRNAQCFSGAGRLPLRAHALKVARYIPFVQLGEAPVLKGPDTDLGRLAQFLSFGGVFGDALL